MNGFMVPAQQSVHHCSTKVVMDDGMALIDCEIVRGKATHLEVPFP